MHTIRKIAVTVSGLSALILMSAGAASASTPAAIWHMNDPAGSTTMADSSGNLNTGVLHNVIAGAAGKFGTAFKFRTAAKSYVEVADSPSLNPGSQPLSISFWFNTLSVPSSGDYDLVRKGTYPGAEYKIELLKTGAINCEFAGTLSHVVMTAGLGLNNGKWHQVQCISNSAFSELLIDGALAVKTSQVAGAITNTSPVEIGAHPTFDFYQGRLDEVTIAVG